jgi:hypothetical protein
MPTIADHILDAPEAVYKNAGTSRLHDINEFNPYMVKDGELIFVKTDFIINGYFANHCLNKISNTFNLITGISDYQLGVGSSPGYKQILEHSNLNSWICTNPPNEYHHKIVPIPIGFQEPDRPGGNQKFLEDICVSQTGFGNKKDAIFLPYHNLSTNSYRQKLVEWLKTLPFVEVQEKKQTLNNYYRSLEQYKFVICLEGNGPDIHRNYETMLVGSIPINLRNTVRRVFDYHGVQAIFLDSWQELDNNLFNKLTKMVYDSENNNRFLKVENHISHIKDIIK